VLVLQSDSHTGSSRPSSGPADGAKSPSGSSHATRDNLQPKKRPLGLRSVCAGETCNDPLSMGHENLTTATRSPFEYQPNRSKQTAQNRRTRMGSVSVHVNIRASGDFIGLRTQMRPMARIPSRREEAPNFDGGKWTLLSNSSIIQLSGRSPNTNTWCVYRMIPDKCSSVMIIAGSSNGESRKHLHHRNQGQDVGNDPISSEEPSMSRGM
jgi:hypothetical protein